MKNKANKSTNKPDQIDEIIERLTTAARLSAEDKKIFATNLGKIASRLDNTNPRAGAKKIIEQSGQQGIWQKRKRYFRLPGEDTPSIIKEGEYASNPTTFIALAEAAAVLLCNSTKSEVIAREKKDIN